MDEYLAEEAVLLKLKNKPSWFHILGSSLLFAVAYISLFAIYDLVTAFVAAHYQTEPILFFDTIKFDNNDVWYPRGVINTFSIGAIIMLLSGIFSIFMLRLSKESSIALRLTWIWFGLLSFVILSQRLSGILAAPNFPFLDLDSKGLELAIVSAYLFLGKSSQVGVAFVGLLICISSSFLFVKPFLQTASSVYQIDTPKYRKLFLRHHLLFPAIIGSVLITAASFPRNLVPNFLSLVMLTVSLTTIAVIALRIGPLIRKQTNAGLWPIWAGGAFLLLTVLINTALKTGVRIPDPGIRDLLHLF